jgi:hypothetical protein
VSDLNGLLSTLTVMPKKAVLYKKEGLIDNFLTSDNTEHVSSLRVAEHLTIALMRPELAVQRKSQMCLSLLEKHGFYAVRCEPVAVGPLCNQMWRFQWNAATDGLLHLAQRLYASHTCMAMILWAPERSKVPASVRLSYLKGSADPAGRPADTLRSQLGSSNKLLALVHSPDEPIDLLREVALLSRYNVALAEPLSTVLDSTDEGPIAADVRKVAAVWESNVKAQSLDVRPRLSILEEAVRFSHGDPRNIATAMQIINAMRGGARVEWISFIKLLASLEIFLEEWDDIVLGASYAKINRRIPKELGSAPSGNWFTRNEWRPDIQNLGSSGRTR